MADNKTKIKFRATLEANKISRMKLEHAYDKLEEFQKQFKSAKGDRRIWLSSVMEVLEQKLEQKEEALSNMAMDGPVDGAVGFGCGGGDGRDAG